MTRGLARAIGLWALLLAPVAAISWALVLWGRTEPGTWLMLIPLTFTWLAIFDFRRGFGARLVRPPRSIPRGADADADANADA